MSLTDPLPPQTAIRAPSPNVPNQQRRTRRVRPLTWLLLLAIIGPCTAVQAPLEIGRWHLAAALNLRGKGEKDAAYEELAAAMVWFPKSPELLLQRAEWRLEDGRRAEALADCDRMLELGGNQENWLKAHAQFFQNAGEFALAVDDWKKIEELSQRSGNPPRSEALNGLAYAQALANIELDEALNNVNQALELQPVSNEAILDTRGYIFHLQERNALALADLDLAVKGMDEYVQQVGKVLVGQDSLPPQSKRLISSGPKTLLEIYPSRGTVAHRFASLTRSAAVIHYHRSLVLAALGRNDEADQERAIARQLIGREPDETLF
jgi:tetratricopeptide (TPR) repeat protein